MQEREKESRSGKEGEKEKERRTERKREKRKEGKSLADYQLHLFIFFSSGAHRFPSEKVPSVP